MGELPFKNLGEMIASRGREVADRTAIQYYDETLTYADLDRKANQAANVFRSLGVKKGDIVSVCSWNAPEVLISYFGAHKIGAAAGPVIADFKGEEIEYVLNHSEAVALVVDAALLPTIEAVRGKLKFLKHILLIGEGTSPRFPRFRDLLDQASDAAPKEEVGPEDMAYLFYTAGTTGFPKGVPLTHRNILSYFAAPEGGAAPSQGAGLMGGGGAAVIPLPLVFLVILPLFHVNAMMTSTLCLCRGLAVCLRKKFSASEFWGIVERYKVNVMSAVPAVYTILLKDEENYKKHDRSSLFLCITGAAAIPPETIKAFEEKFGVTMIEGYGLTEGTVGSTINPPGERKIGSVGKAMPGQELAILDDDGKILKTGEVGEICIRGQNIMKGYYKNPEATAEVLKNGWLHSGDMGYIDAEGFIYIVGRKKDMLIRGGENIYPKQIENVLTENAKVLEAAVVGVPDEVMGEEVMAFIILKPGQKSTVDEMKEFARSKLADFKVPRYIEFVDDMPRNPVGKVLKRELREVGKKRVAPPAARA